MSNMATQRLFGILIALSMCPAESSYSAITTEGDTGGDQTQNAPLSGQSTNAVPAEKNGTNQPIAHPDLFASLANNAAWIFATSADANNRNGAIAVELAQYACERTHYSHVLQIGTLSAAYAEAGRFDEAVATARAASHMASMAGKPDLVYRYQRLLALFSAHQPYHYPPAPDQREESATNVGALAISNLSFHRDTSGQIVDAHDGCLQFFDGRFYLYGTAYGTNDYYQTNHRYRVYSSPDLQTWTYEGELLRGQPSGVYYRPYVVFNPTTRKYVLWYNWYPKLWDGHTGVAVSDTPTGPFSMVSTNVHLSKSTTGDGSLFVDDDGTGYFIYTTIKEGHTVCVERLTPDYLASTGETSGNLAENSEAPVLFRRNNTYYALCSSLCMACTNGSDVASYMAASPLGPYGPPWYINSSPKKSPLNFPAQETWVAKIPTSRGPAYIWMADCWGSSADNVNGHDLQYWSPLEFGPNGEILPIKFPTDFKLFHFALAAQPDSHSK